jgi:glucose/arabinose dehydrogenase
VFESREQRFRVETVAQGLEHPWGLAFLPDGRLLVTERAGRLNLIDPASGRRTPIAGTPEVVVANQGGLLDVALHPQFERTGWVYLSYVAPLGRGTATHVGRGRLVDGKLQDFTRLFRAEPFARKAKHFGSRLVFDRDGNLFISLGDRDDRQRAQKLDDHNGSLIRLTADGGVPADNPFVARRGARPEIYSYGHRNIQGMTLHPQTGRIWLHEHGPRGGDEINLPQPGRNYGWPAVTYGREYYGPSIGTTEAPDVEQPVHQWTPSIAPSGMAFYSGDKLPGWRGDLFVGALAGHHLARLRVQGDKVIEEERLLEGEGLRVRAVQQGPDGLLYLLIDRPQAPILRLRPL